MAVSGTVKFYSPSKGFGFIAPNDGSQDVFVHATDLRASGIPHELQKGEAVSFVIKAGPRGPKAINVALAE